MEPETQVDQIPCFPKWSPYGEGKPFYDGEYARWWYEVAIWEAYNHRQNEVYKGLWWVEFNVPDYLTCHRHPLLVPYLVKRELWSALKEGSDYAPYNW